MVGSQRVGGEFDGHPSVLRMREVHRMNNEANIAELLAEETEASERGRDMDAPYVASRRRSKDPSQVYSVRLPVGRLEDLRQLASKEGVAPSALLRRWAIERIDRELDHASRVAEERERQAVDNDEVLVLTRGQLESMIDSYVYDNAPRIARMIGSNIRSDR